MNVFSRPLFKNQFVQRYAEGGIVSTVADAAPVDPNTVLRQFAAQTDQTEMNIDNANNIDEILSGFAGEPRTAEQARGELAGIVGAKDAAETPESVLALVQPTLEIMKMSQSMGPQEGIGSVPLGPEEPMMGVQTPMGFTPAQPQAEPFQPVAQFAVGGEVSPLSGYIQSYSAMRKDPALANLGYNAQDYWTALGMLGAGIAQGKTLAEGLSMGTQLSAPYLQQARKNQSAEQAAALEYAMTADAAAKKAAADAEKLRQEIEADRRNAQLAAESRIEAATISANSPSTMEKDANAFVSSYNIPLDSAQGLKLKNFYIQYGSDGMASARAVATKLAPDAAPGSPEYMDALSTAIVQLKEAGGTKISNSYSPGEKGVPDFFKDQRTQFKDLNDKFTKDAQRKGQLELLSQIMSLKPEQGGPVFGPGAQGRILLEEGAKLVGIDPGQYTTLLNGGEYTRLADMIIKGLTVDANAEINRATNLSLTLLGEAQANIGSSPESNILWTEINKRAVDWNLKNQQYAADLDNYYGALNPRDLKRLDPERPEIQGVDFVNKPLTEITEADLYTEDGKPRLSYNQYVAWRRLNDPAVPSDMIAQLSNLAKGQPVNLSSIGLSLPEAGSVAVPTTEMDVWNTQGADVGVPNRQLQINETVTVQEKELQEILNQDHNGAPMIEIENPQTGQKEYYERKILPNGRVQYQLKRQ